MPQIMIFGGGPRRTFTAISAALTSSATFNFGTLNFGDVLPGRKLVLGVTCEATGTNFAINSVSVAGSGATSIVDRAHTDSVSKCRAALYRIADATNASGNVTVSLAGSIARCQVGIWALYDLANAAPSFTGQDSDSDGNTSSFGIDIPAVGITVALGVILSGSGTQTLSGMATIDASEGIPVSQRQWASYQATAAEVGRTISFSGGASGSDVARALVAASWS